MSLSHRYIIVVESANPPAGSPPTARRVKDAAKAMPALFLRVLAVDQIPADVDVTKQVARIDPLHQLDPTATSE